MRRLLQFCRFTASFCLAISVAPAFSEEGASLQGNTRLRSGAETAGENAGGPSSVTDAYSDYFESRVGLNFDRVAEDGAPPRARLYFDDQGYNDDSVWDDDDPTVSSDRAYFSAALRVFGGPRQAGISLSRTGTTLSSRIRPLETGHHRVINWGTSNNQEFRDRDPESIPQNRTFFDRNRGRTTIDPRDVDSIQYEEEQRIPRGEITERLLEQYTLLPSGGAINSTVALEETGGFGGIAYGRSFNVESLNVIAGHFYSLVGYEVVRAPDNFFYSHAFAMQNAEPFNHTGVISQVYLEGFATGGSYPGFDTGWDTTHASRVQTRFTDEVVRNLGRDPGVIHTNQFHEETRSSLDLNTYQIGVTAGIEQVCLPCDVSCGLFFPFGVQFNDWDLREQRRLTQNGSLIGESDVSRSGTDAEFFLNIEGRVGFPVGRAKLEFFVGTQLAGGETVAKAGGTQAVISSDADKNVYGGVSFGLPFDALFRP